MKQFLLASVLLPLLVSCNEKDSTLHADESAYASYRGLAMAGYQGWFNAPGDGADRGFNHYVKNKKFEPGACTIDAWPDMSEYTVKYETPFRNADGSTALVFSSYDKSTTDLHFRWMREYGIDGVFMQRFVSSIKSPKSRNHTNTILNNALEAATENDRAICVMYDLSGMKPEDADVVIEDWKNLVSEMKLTSRKNNHYLYHNGKPLVAVWGVGFSGKGRKYSLADSEKIIDFLKNDPIYGGCSVLLGLPTHWRELTGDSTSDAHLHDMIRKCDIVLPWFVGRYKSEADFEKFSSLIAEDLRWCKENHLDYAPVIWPGFSWHNLKEGTDQESPVNSVPRNGGRFFWKQVATDLNLGAEMLYYAMFDEIDEGTALFKITDNPPVGASSFIDLEGLPSDWYLRLAGAGARMLKKEIPFNEEIPIRK